MASFLVNSYGLGPCGAPSPYEFIGLGAMHCDLPYASIGFGAMDCDCLINSHSLGQWMTTIDRLRQPLEGAGMTVEIRRLLLDVVRLSYEFHMIF